ncbi:hypothetical protein Plhal304r1_c014g0054201 [Plasmopara halstedii]
MDVLWNFVLTSLLLTNTVCILHEKRFLRSLPLMIINTLMILLELVMG